MATLLAIAEMPKRRYLRHSLRDGRIKYPRFKPPTSDHEWTPALAYAVGLIATDGCLSKDGKTVTQVSKDADLIEIFKQCIGSQAPIAWNRRAFRVQISDVGLYTWLQGLGLTTRKSLTLVAFQCRTVSSLISCADCSMETGAS